MRRVLVAVVTLAAALLGVPSLAGAATPVSHSAPPVTYSALGDSYATGVGAPPYDLGANCLRSSRGYPALWRSTHAVASFDLLACSGAKTTDLLATQIPALSPNADLVTVTIGGNDVGFAPVVTNCTIAPTDEECAAVVHGAEVFAVFGLSQELNTTYDAIRAKAPKAKVVVLGYPRLFDTSTATCSQPFVPDEARRSVLNQGADVLDEVIRTVADYHGFAFVDVRGAFAGHGVCSADPWINPPTVPPATENYHPTAVGYRSGYLPALDAVTG